jgi:hypothetical protein
MRTRWVHILGLIALAASVLHSQPTNGAVYWSATPPDCSILQESAAVSITNSSGAVLGYSCRVSGTFVWFAAGGGWTSKIRVGAPSTAPIGVDYTFYDTNGNNLNLDTTSGGSAKASGNEVSFALSANQPSEIVMLGAASSAPAYGPTTDGTVYAKFYCPDATTCQNVLPQLVYLQQPTHPWLATVPITWGIQVWPTWSAEGVDDGVTNVVSFAVYNEGTVATSYKINVYDHSGSLVASGSTPLVPPSPLLNDGTYGEAGTYAATLRTVISSPLPSGIFKVMIDGGNEVCAVLMLQFSGMQYPAPSMSSMQVAFDASPGSNAMSAAAARNAHAERARSIPTQVQAFGALPQ